MFSSITVSFSISWGLSALGTYGLTGARVQMRAVVLAW